MARLSAYDRREWIRVERGNEMRTYMSDGIVLRKMRDHAGSWGPWRVWGTWEKTRSVKEYRAELAAQGWTVLQVPLERGAA
jgi:hypothetical protein